MIRILFFFILLNFYNPAFSSIKDKIIYRLNSIDNFSFNFIQTVNQKEEGGSCIIEYPKKIYCEYNNPNKKIIVSNGKSLVITNKQNESFYFYPLKKTPLELLLDKVFLISKIRNLTPREIDNKYINFKILENNNLIDIFFDKKTFDLVGWQLEDIYQNLSITFISSLKVNQKIDKRIFKLPKRN